MSLKDEFPDVPENTQVFTKSVPRPARQQARSFLDDVLNAGRIGAAVINAARPDLVPKTISKLNLGPTYEPIAQQVAYQAIPRQATIPLDAMGMPKGSALDVGELPAQEGTYRGMKVRIPF